MNKTVIIKDGVINFDEVDSDFAYPEILMISLNYNIEGDGLHLRYTYSDTPEGLILVNKYLNISKIKSVLKGSKLYGNNWKSNIHTIKFEDQSYMKVIIVYTEEWNNYSETKKNNRLKKIGSDLIGKYNNKEK